jgi:uncharacterized integral membrane protein (TIGR00698 family)
MHKLHEALRSPILFLSASALIFFYFQISPALALFSGFFVSYFKINSDKAASSKISKLLMGLAIVFLGLSVNLELILSVSKEYFLVTLSGIALTILLARISGEYLKLSKVSSVLIGTGTAICGVSAIAAVSSAVKAKPEETSLALAVVLIFNALALFLFPLVGQTLDLSAVDFGAWAGLAIHDTSSVVGAALVYSIDSVETATTVKLARAIWIAPLVIVCCRMFSKDQKLSVQSFRIPWFIWGYVFAAGIAPYLKLSAAAGSEVVVISRHIFSLSLFLIGSSVELSIMKQVGVRPFVLGLGLWVFAALWSLALI